MSPSDPEPERQNPRPGAGDSDSQANRGGAYVPLPPNPTPTPSKKLALAAGALAALLAGTGIFQMLRAPAPPVQPPAETGLALAAKTKKVFLVSMKDLDAQATSRARQTMGAPGTASAGEPSRDPSMLSAPGPGVVRTDGLRAPELRPAPAPPAQAPDGSGVLDALSAAPQTVKEQVRNGSMSLFTFHFVDFVAEDGDIVGVSVDGRDLGRVTLSHAGASLTIPLKPGEQHVIRFTALHDGGGGVTFGAVSSVGRLKTKVMTVGEYDEWVIAFQSELGR